MALLALDTSTGPASAALFDDGGTAIAIHEDAQPMRQSQKLVSEVDAMMRTHGGYGQLHALAVTTGPGGFTGIRIALAAARGFAIACGIPLLGISSLESLAWQALHDAAEGTQAVALVNAFRNQVYWQAFTRSAQGMEPQSEAQALDITALADTLAAYPCATVIGNLPPESVTRPVYRHHPAPHARYAGMYALTLLAVDHAGAIAGHPAEALYIRPPDAKPQKPLLGA